MKCTQRPFTRKKLKKTKTRRPSRCYKGFISMVYQWNLLLNALVNNMSSEETSNIEKLADTSKWNFVSWEKTNPTQKIAFFFYFLSDRADYNNIRPFTLNLSDEIKESYNRLTYKQATQCIRKRLTDEFIHWLGYIPRYMFVIENKNTPVKQMHLHGVIEVNPEKEDKLRNAMKAAGFGHGYKNNPMHQYILRIEKDRDKTLKKWLRYINKSPSAAYSIFITSSLKRDIKIAYEELRDKYKCYRKSQNNRRN